MSCSCKLLSTYSDVYDGCHTSFDRFVGAKSMRDGVLEHGVQFFQLDPGVLHREPPADLGLRSVSMLFPRSDFRPQERDFVDTPVEALAGKDAQFRLRHVQPTAVLRGVMHFQA